MSNAYRDGNFVTTMIAGLNTNGITPQRVYVSNSTNALKISDGTTGSNFGPVNAPRDGNRITCLMGVSSVDGQTPVTIYADSSGNLLTQST